MVWRENAMVRVMLTLGCGTSAASRETYRGPTPLYGRGVTILGGIEVQPGARVALIALGLQRSARVSG
jgi:hypothetical protein